MDTTNGLRLCAVVAASVALSGCTHLRSSAPAADASQAATPAPGASGDVTAKTNGEQPSSSASAQGSTGGQTGTTSADKGKGRSDAKAQGTQDHAAHPAKRQPAPASRNPTATPAQANKPAADTAADASRAPTPAAPALDLKGLEQRLRDTSAIGVLTKLSLKNQVDDLLQQFRVFHSGQTPPTLSELRQHYELLLMKVLGLLQTGDPALAAAISASREAIWGVLIDPQKFAHI